MSDIAKAREIIEEVLCWDIDDHVVAQLVKALALMEREEVKLRDKLIEFLLNRRGLHYFGPQETFISEVEKHHPYIAKEAQAIADFVEKTLAHDALFKEIPPS